MDAKKRMPQNDSDRFVQFFFNFQHSKYEKHKVAKSMDICGQSNVVGRWGVSVSQEGWREGTGWLGEPASLGPPAATAVPENEQETLR